MHIFALFKLFNFLLLNDKNHGMLGYFISALCYFEDYSDILVIRKVQNIQWSRFSEMVKISGTQAPQILNNDKDRVSVRVQHESFHSFLSTWVENYSPPVPRVNTKIDVVSIIHTVHNIVTNEHRRRPIHLNR